MKESKLTNANKKFSSGNYEKALAEYIEYKNDNPELAYLVDFNISLIENKIAIHKSQLINEKIVVYSCNFGNYETVKDPLFKDESIEYILFTDNKNLTSSVWKIVVLDEKLSDPRRTSRLTKILPHRYLPPHDISIYIDSSLELKTDNVRKMVVECMEGSDIALYKHYKRSCVYDEIEFVMNSTDRVVANKELCLRAIKKYEEINYPRKNGLFENAFIFRRNTEKIKALNETWWNEYIEGTERDQFTFMYSLWVHKVSPNPIKHGKQFRVNDYVNFHRHVYRAHLKINNERILPHVFIAYAPKSYGMNLGRCYNEYMERLGDDDFALFIDHDAMFVSDSWKETICDIATRHAYDIALFISQTNRINNPYQRLNLLEENHRIEDHRIFANEIFENFSTVTTECAKLPSSSGVVIMLSKKTWKTHKFSDGFLKVDNNIHLSHRDNGDPVHMMRGLYVYHFYRADNDFSHAVRDISSLPKESDSTIGHVVRNFVYSSFSIDQIDRYMNTLLDNEYGVFLPEQSMFCNKDWYIRIVSMIEQDKSIGLMVFGDNGLDLNAPIELDALKHKMYASSMIQRDTECLLNINLTLLKESNRAFLMSKKIWNSLNKEGLGSISLDDFIKVAAQIKQKVKFVPSVYVFNSKIDHRNKKIKHYLDKKLNIGILTMGFWPQQAGMEMMVHNLAKQLTETGSNVVLFAPKPKKEFQELKCNYLIRRFKNFDDMKQKFRDHHASMPFDVLYVQGALEPASVALDLKRELGVSVVLRTHGEDIQIDEESNYGYRLDPKKNEIILSNIRSVNHNVVIGPHILEDVKEITNNPISLIFNGVDTNHFKFSRQPLIHERLGLDPATKILITVGRNVKKKSLHLAIDALAILKKKFDNVVLVHVGKEGNGLNLSEYAKERGLSSSFHQLGEISYFDMPNIYCSADIFVFPSKTETFGNVTVEAMSCGLPCVEFDYEVNRDKIIEGKSGYIVPYGDIQLFAERILSILENDEIRDSMSKASRALSVNKFSWTIVREQYMSIFQSVIKRK